LFGTLNEPRSDALSSTHHLQALLLFHHVIVVIIIIIFIVVVVVWFGLEIFDLLLQLYVSL
ncbi:unnamed protein product, partial [Prunus brigantina]